MHLRAMTHSFLSSDSFICLPICNVMTPPRPLLTWCVRHDSSRCMQWSIHTCAITHPYVCHDSSIRVPWFVDICAMTHSFVFHVAFICVPWLIHFCHLTHSYVFLFHDSFICVPLRIHMCAMTHLFLSSDSFICLPIPWLIHLCSTSHSYVCHESFMYVQWVIPISRMSHSHVFFSLANALVLYYVCHGSSICVPRVITSYHELSMSHSVGENSQQIWVLPKESDRYRTRQVIIILVPWI